MKLSSIAGLAAVGAIAYWAKNRGQAQQPVPQTVGPYGTSDGTSEGMNRVDNTIDDSFPASDPPGNY